MSISEASKPVIKYSTAKDICDDIWDGAFDYANETGTRKHPLAMMMLWAGLLFSVKEDLEEYGIFDDVQREFVRTFADIYDISINDLEILTDIKERMHQFFTILVEEVESISSERDCFIFLDVLEGSFPDYFGDSKMSLSARVQCFSRTVSLLSSHIYGIVHEVTGSILRQFPPAPRFRQQPEPKPQPQTSPVRYHNTGSTPEESPNTTKTLTIYVCIALLLLLMVAAVLSSNASDTPTVSQPETTAPQLTPMARPANGEIFIGRNVPDSTTITVTADGSNDYLVKLKDSSGKTRSVFYVRAGKTVTIGVPQGHYYVYFASGTEWYGYREGRMFGENTSYSKDDELLDFTQYSWTYTLQPVSNGNFSETPSNADEFF